MTSELRERLFAEVEQKLLEFKKTPAYRDMLFRQVKEALDFAAGDEMTVYLDPSDTHLANAITEEINITGFAPLSQRKLSGGMRDAMRNQETGSVVASGFHFVFKFLILALTAPDPFRLS